jgi:hypothetical protein
VMVFVFRVPDAADLLEDIVQWISGKNVFIEEDCMIINFGLVVVCSSLCHNRLMLGLL